MSRRRHRPNRRLYRRQLKVILDGLKDDCVNAIAQGEHEKARHLKKEIEKKKKELRRY